MLFEQIFKRDLNLHAPTIFSWLNAKTGNHCHHQRLPRVGLPKKCL